MVKRLFEITNERGGKHTTVFHRPMIITQHITTDTINMKPQIKISSALAILVLAIVLNECKMASCRPSRLSPLQNALEGKGKMEGSCDNDQTTMEVCQRCAKATKSPMVFPMCCENEDHALKWCHEYVLFGLQQQKFD